MGDKPRVSGGLLDGVNARIDELEEVVARLSGGEPNGWVAQKIHDLERRVAQSENLVAKIRLECYEAGPCLGCRSRLCLQCRLYRMMTEDTPVE